jgi:methylmalonyl-CoA/ethylmalonyl-CoA epimerase
MNLHHVGIVVKDLQAHGAAYASSLGLIPEAGVVHDPIQKVNIRFWRDSSGNLLELIEPADATSPVAQAATKGGGLNHLCYEVEDIEQQVARAVENGAILLGRIVPAVAISNRRVAFLYFRKLGLIEYLEASLKHEHAQEV